VSGSNTTRSKQRMEEQGYAVDVVESWNHYTQRRKDLFGIWDLLGVKEGSTLAVQTTSYGEVSKRVRKIAESPHIAAIRAAGWRLEVHGWRKVNGRWQARVVDVS
jgi:hypothetical protein